MLRNFFSANDPCVVFRSNSVRLSRNQRGKAGVIVFRTRFSISIQENVAAVRERMFFSRKFFRLNLDAFRGWMHSQKIVEISNVDLVDFSFLIALTTGRVSSQKRWILTFRTFFLLFLFFKEINRSIFLRSSAKHFPRSRDYVEIVICCVHVIERGEQVARL